MSSIRLRPDQIARLKKTGNIRAIILRAIERYERGDFVIPKRDKKKKPKEVLRVVSISKPFEKYTDNQIRKILDQHFRIPDWKFRQQCQAQIDELNKEIDELMSVFCQRNKNEYRIAKDDEEE